MCNENGEKSALEENIEKLKEFLEKVKKGEPDIYRNHKNLVEHALKYQDKFVEVVKNFNYDSFNFNYDRDIFNNLKELRSIGGRLDTNFYESLKDFIKFYEVAAESGSFTTNDLLQAREALEYQFNLTKHMQGLDLNLDEEGKCGRRPHSPVSLPVEP